MRMFIWDDISLNYYIILILIIKDELIDKLKGERMWNYGQ